MNKIHVFFGQTTVVKHSDPFFKRETASGVWLDKRLVTHKESTHQLQDSNFDWEVEWSNASYSSKRPSVSDRVLALMVSWNLETFSQESDVVTSKVFKKCSSDFNFIIRLSITLGD